MDGPLGELQGEASQRRIAQPYPVGVVPRECADSAASLILLRLAARGADMVGLLRVLPLSLQQAAIHLLLCPLVVRLHSQVKLLGKVRSGLEFLRMVEAIDLSLE